MIEKNEMQDELSFSSSNGYSGDQQLDQYTAQGYITFLFSTYSTPYYIIINLHYRYIIAQKCIVSLDMVFDLNNDNNLYCNMTLKLIVLYFLEDFLLFNIWPNCTVLLAYGTPSDLGYPSQPIMLDDHYSPPQQQQYFSEQNNGVQYQYQSLVRL